MYILQTCSIIVNSLRVIFQILDISTYYLDLSIANKLKKAEWKLEYNFKDALKIQKISPQALYKAAHDINVGEDKFWIFSSSRVLLPKVTS